MALAFFRVFHSRGELVKKNHCPWSVVTHRSNGMTSEITQLRLQYSALLLYSEGKPREVQYRNLSFINTVASIVVCIHLFGSHATCSPPPKKSIA